MKKLKKRVFWAALAVILICFEAFGFDSAPPPLQGHREISSEAMMRFGFSVTAMFRVVDANLATDVREMFDGRHVGQATRHYRPAHHFDRHPKQAHQPAFDNGVRYLAAEWAVMIGYINAHQIIDAWHSFGRASHTLQDFFSHSNYVDLIKTEQLQVIDALFRFMPQAAAKNAQPPLSLKLTSFDKNKGGGADNGDIYHYQHDIFNKDNLRETKEAKKMINGRTKYDIAFIHAEKATELFIQYIRSTVGPIKFREFLRPHLK